MWVHSQVQGILLQTNGWRANWERGPAVGGVPQRRTEPLWGWRALRAASSLKTRSQTLIDLFRLLPGQCLHLTLWLGAKGAQGLEAPHPAYSTEFFFFFSVQDPGASGDGSLSINEHLGSICHSASTPGGGGIVGSTGPIVLKREFELLAAFCSFSQHTFSRMGAPALRRGSLTLLGDGVSMQEAGCPPKLKVVGGLGMRQWNTCPCLVLLTALFPFSSCI